MPAITISSNGVIRWHDQKEQHHQCRCALGSGGMCAVDAKAEGDGATPMGEYHLRRLLYRADRVEKPVSALPCRAIRDDDGWCDDPQDAAYNRPVVLPYAASCERLMREDHVYDLVGIVSHNDSPPVPGLGSAIFIHLARSDYSPTRGCIALAETDLRSLFAMATAQTPIRIDC